jgi:hypothetical protein
MLAMALPPLPLPDLLTQLFLANLAMLLASRTDLTPQVTDGILSGQGNQGSASTVMNMGRAGTAGVQISVPRSQNFGAGGLVQGSNP